MFWASWGGSRKEPGCGNRLRETGFRTRGIAKVPGSEGCVAEVSKVSVFDGFDGLGSVPEVWTEPVLELGTGGVKKVPSSGDSVPKFPKVTLYFESILLYFESAFLYFESVLL